MLLNQLQRLVNDLFSQKHTNKTCEKGTLMSLIYSNTLENKSKKKQGNI